MIVETALAKINLALHVTGQRADGYHLLDSLVVFADCGDVLRFEPADRLTLEVTGPMAEGVPTGPENLILRAAALFGTDKGARITLEKHLPHAAGIGGGSADAAAALRGLARLWEQRPPPLNDVLTIGSDVPVCLRGHPAWMRGTGEILEDVLPLPEFWAVLVNPGVALPTKAVFSGLSSRRNRQMETPVWADQRSFFKWLSRQRNDLEGAALDLAPEVELALSALDQARDCRLARMSGSGATCFGLFGNADRAADAANAIARAHPGWWVIATAFAPRGP